MGLWDLHLGRAAQLDDVQEGGGILDEEELESMLRDNYSTFIYGVLITLITICFFLTSIQKKLRSQAKKVSLEASWAEYTCNGLHLTRSCSSSLLANVSRSAIEMGCYHREIIHKKGIMAGQQDSKPEYPTSQLEVAEKQEPYENEERLESAQSELSVVQARGDGESSGYVRELKQLYSNSQIRMQKVLAERKELEGELSSLEARVREAMLREREETEVRLEAARQEIQALKDQLLMIRQEKTDARNMVTQLVNSIPISGIQRTGKSDESIELVDDDEYETFDEKSLHSDEAENEDGNLDVQLALMNSSSGEVMYNGQERSTLPLELSLLSERLVTGSKSFRHFIHQNFQS